MGILLRLWRSLTRPNNSITDIEERRQSQLLASLIVGLILPAGLAFVVATIRNGASESSLYSFIAIILAIGIYFVNRSGRYKLAAYLFLALVFLLFNSLPLLISDLSWLLYTTLCITLTAILVPRLALPAFVINFLWLVVLGILSPATDEIDNFAITVFLGIIGTSILVFVNHRTILEKERQAELRGVNQALKESEAELEKRVIARTRDLKVASDVARGITTVLDLDELLPHLVNQTKNAFNLSFVSIFLFQPEAHRLLIVAGTGEAGRQMRAEGLSYDLAARPSLVAKAARERQSIVISDVSQADVHAHNPHLADTKSEAVFPMLVGDELIGVMGTQSEIVGRFRPEDVEIFNTLAEQIAIAVKNAQLFEIQKRQAEELRRADQTKSQFLASMSHELRTPMNAIINFTEMIAMGMIGPVNEDQVDLLNQSLDSSKYLLHLINDVLDISKIQAGKLALFVEDDVDLQAELKTAVGMVEPLLINKPVTLIQDIDNDLPILSGDKRRIRQIVLNLLTNAAKFTDEGSITFSVKRKDNDILIAVADTGPGISEELQAIIFEPFTQTESGLKHAEGTGLGLPITMSLVEAHGGRLWLESEQDEGASFFVTLPLQAVRV